MIQVPHQQRRDLARRTPTSCLKENALIDIGCLTGATRPRDIYATPALTEGQQR